MSQIPDNVIARATKKLSQAAAWQKYQRYLTKNKKFFDEQSKLAEQGKLSGYFVHDAGQKESCDICRAHDGQFFKFNPDSRENHLPPFHPNCECYMEVEKSRDAVPYDIKTGLIGEGATNTLVVAIINKELGIHTDWKTVAMVSEFPEGENAEDLSGRRTYVKASTLNVDREMRIEMGLIKAHLDPCIDKLLPVRMIWYIGKVGRGEEFDLKARAGSIWASPPKERAYIFKSQLIRYDAPGNILAGYGAAHIDIPLWVARGGAHAVSVISGLGIDDPVDQGYIEDGYNLYR